MSKKVAAITGSADGPGKGIAERLAAFGPVDVFINNAGIEDVMPLDDVREPDREKVFSANVYSVVTGQSIMIDGGIVLR